MDVLIAMTVLAMGLTSIIQLQATALDMGRQTKYRAEALRLAEKKLEELRHVVNYNSARSWNIEDNPLQTEPGDLFRLDWEAIHHSRNNFNTLSIDVT